MQCCSYRHSFFHPAATDSICIMRDQYLDKDEIWETAACQPIFPAIPVLHNMARVKAPAHGLLHQQYGTCLSITLRKILGALENRWPFYLPEANH